MKKISIILLLTFSALSSVLSSTPSMIDFERQWRFPRELSGFKFLGAEKYKNEDQGYSLYYGTAEEGPVLEVSVLNQGFETIPDGCKSSEIKTFLQNAESELKWKVDQKQLKNLSRLKDIVAPPKNKISFRCARFEYTEADTPSESLHKVVGVTGNQNQFVAFRYLTTNEVLTAITQTSSALSQMLAEQPEKDQILLDACALFLESPSSFPGLLSAQYLMGQAQNMDNLNVYPQFFVWPKSYYAKPRNADLLVAAYFAGVLQVVVPAHLDEGGEFEGFIAMLNTYEKLRKVDQIQSIEELDKWLKTSDKKALFQEVISRPLPDDE
jgi:hypothetical protein